jgi:t-SNARE complex subunit (syntaxin)
MEALHLARESAALKGMVADVHGLVHEQEEAVAEVEEQVSSALARTEAGVAELEIAKTYVTSYRRKWACVGLLVTLAVAVPLALHFAVPAGTVGHI